MISKFFEKSIKKNLEKFKKVFDRYFLKKSFGKQNFSIKKLGGYMKKLVLVFSFLVLTILIFGQTTIDFETEGDGYTPSTTFGSGTTDVFNRVNPDIGGNATYLWAAEDISGNPSIVLDQIDITGATTFSFSIDFLTPNTNDWDSTDELLITFTVDGGANQNLMWVQHIPDDGYNEPAALDLAFDGDGDVGEELPAITDGHGTGVGSDFETFSRLDIPVSGSGLDITLQFNNLTSNDEGIYLDNITITQGFGNALPVIANIVQTPAADITSSTTVSVSADVTDSDGTITLVELHWGLVSGSLTNTINMSNSGGDTYTTDSDIPAQSDGTTVYYEVYAEDDVPESSTSAELNYTVTDPATTTIPYYEDFSSGFGDIYTYDVSGDDYWYVTSGYANINGYPNTDPIDEDWMILPSINFGNYSDEQLAFDAWWRYGNQDADNYLRLYYSTDYSGLGDPTGSTWIELSFTIPPVEETWTPTTVDLSLLPANSIYLAFKYYSDDAARWWEIDNIAITEEPPLAVTLSEFTAQYASGTLSLYWTTQTETENAGWNIYRGDSENAEQSIQINSGLIDGAGTTSEPTEYVFVDESEVMEGSTYWYWIESQSNSGETDIYGPISLTIPIEGEDPDGPDSERYGLFQNYPNPVSNRTTISFSLTEEKVCKLSIYNTKGQTIKVLYQGSSKGDSFVWDRTDNFGNAVASGIYFYKLEAGTEVYTKKMIVTE